MVCRIGRVGKATGSGTVKFTGGMSGTSVNNTTLWHIVVLLSILAVPYTPVTKTFPCESFVNVKGRFWPSTSPNMLFIVPAASSSLGHQDPLTML